MRFLQSVSTSMLIAWHCVASACAQLPNPGAGGLSSPQMVPISPVSPQAGFPSTVPSGTNFDPYSRPTAPSFGSTILGVPQSLGAGVASGIGAPSLGAPTVPAPNYGTTYGQTAPFGQPNFGAPVLPPNGYPNTGVTAPGGLGYTGPAPLVPGVGQSATVNTFPNNPLNYNQPGPYGYNSPSALFPGANPTPGSGPVFGGIFRNWYNGLFGGGSQPAVMQPGAAPYGGGYNAGVWNNWNPQGSMLNGGFTPPGFVRLFQGPRFRHAYVFGNNDEDALAINDTDVSLTFAIPNFLFSTQPLYLLPSFSLHQWDGPHPNATADLPALAYSAFLDSGWQSDPARILGGELGLRVGMFTDFNTATTDSLRIMGRGIGRIRLTPRLTLKGGVIYLDRQRTKLLPAGGILWQPQVNTRLDIFFPEPKLSSYLTTVGNVDTWWYAGGYYGGGSWTVERFSGTKESVDINDLRIVFGLEFGRNEAMREGRRNGFIEVGYVFDRELFFESSVDNMDLQDTVMVRAGFGY